jgi:hypothetical protein
MLSGLTLLLLTSTAFAQQIENAEYKDWARFKVGTAVTMKQTTAMPASALPPGMPAGFDMAAMMPQISITTKLIDLKPDSLTLEISNTSTQMGRSNTTKTTRVVAAKIEKPTTVPATQDASIKNLKEGKDTIDINGKKYEATTREYDGTATVAGVTATSHVKIWTVPAIPGGMVKTETTTKTAELGDMTSTMTVVDFVQAL